jgi:hypothetical protein
LELHSQIQVGKRFWSSNSTSKIKIKPASSVEVTCRNEKDKFIGRTWIPVSTFANDDRHENTWIPIFDKKEKKVGEIMVIQRNC